MLNITVTFVVMLICFETVIKNQKISSQADVNSIPVLGNFSLLSGKMSVHESGMPLHSSLESCQPHGPCLCVGEVASVFTQTCPTVFDSLIVRNTV